MLLVDEYFDENDIINFNERSKSNDFSLLAAIKNLIFLKNISKIMASFLIKKKI